QQNSGPCGPPSPKTRRPVMETYTLQTHGGIARHLKPAPPHPKKHPPQKQISLSLCLSLSLSLSLALPHSLSVSLSVSLYLPHSLSVSFPHHQTETERE